LGTKSADVRYIILASIHITGDHYLCVINLEIVGLR
jgi:hypothetical protein